jgi:hypothetical protein
LNNSFNTISRYFLFDPGDELTLRAMNHTLQERHPGSYKVVYNPAKTFFSIEFDDPQVQLMWILFKGNIYEPTAI